MRKRKGRMNVAIFNKEMKKPKGMGLDTGVAAAAGVAWPVRFRAETATREANQQHESPRRS